MYSGARSCEWNWINLKLCGGGCEGKRGSWRCRPCLDEAVISTTSYLLWAHYFNNATRIVSHWDPSPLDFNRSLLFWQIIQTSGVDSPYYASMLLQQVPRRPQASSGTTPPTRQRWAGCSATYTPAFNRCVILSFWKFSSRRTRNWLMTFERFEKWNEKHRAVIAKTNKHFLKQQKQMFQPATDLQREEAVLAGDRQGEQVCFFSADAMFFW